MLGVHEHKLDFEILETGNTKTLVFLDSSQYFEEPDGPMLEVTMPGYNKYFLTEVTARKVNTFNSSTLGFNRVLDIADLTDLPDGVWQFKFKICPYKYIYKIKNYMRVTQLTQKLQNVYQQIDLSDCQTKADKDIQDDLVRIHVLIEGAKAEVNHNLKKAQSYYQLANTLVDKLSKKFCQNCQ